MVHSESPEESLKRLSHWISPILVHDSDSPNKPIEYYPVLSNISAIIDILSLILVHNVILHQWITLCMKHHTCMLSLFINYILFTNIGSSTISPILVYNYSPILSNTVWFIVNHHNILWHVFSTIYGMSSFPLTNSYFSRCLPSRKLSHNYGKSPFYS